jgi:hypothetical protein
MAAQLAASQEGLSSVLKYIHHRQNLIEFGIFHISCLRHSFTQAVPYNVARHGEGKVEGTEIFGKYNVNLATDINCVLLLCNLSSL